MGLLVGLCLPPATLSMNGVLSKPVILIFEISYMKAVISMVPSNLLQIDFYTDVNFEIGME